MKIDGFISTVMLVVLLLIATLGGITQAENEEDWMPDPNLRRIVSEELGVESLTIADMQRLHTLISERDKIENLEGLQHAVNLKFLSINRCNISDLTPLAGLVKLNALEFYDTQISDLTPLAGLVNLKELQLSENQISDLTPLAGLINLEVLLLRENQVSDLSAITGLTKLKELAITDNPIEDFSQIKHFAGAIKNSFDRWCLSLFDDFSYKLPLAERIQNRDFPSNWVKSHTLAEHDQHTIEIFTVFDFIFGVHPFGPLGNNVRTIWLSPEGINATLRTGQMDKMIETHTEVLRLNPNMILLVGLYFESGHPDFYGEDWEGWLRDKEGNRLTSVWRRHATEELIDHLIDFTKPAVIEQIVQQAKSISECGLYDGIFFDHWGEGKKRLQGIYTAEEESIAMDTILRRIREVVPDDFFILVNNNRRKLQPRWAPYVNGIYMETGRDFYDFHPGEPEGYTLSGIRDIEDALLWNETKLRKPTLNLLEGEVSPFKPIDGSEAKQRNRFFTTMALTHSNASVYMLHYEDFFWYDFYDAPLGRPIGGDETKAQLYEDREGLFIREFTNGWAVYNRSGTAQEIELSQEVSGWSSGVKNQRWHTLSDLDGEIYLKTVVQVAPGKYPHLYWIDTKTGTLQQLVDPEVKNLVLGVQNATSLTVDTANEKLYWTEKTSQRTGKIQRANLGGTNVQLVRALTSAPFDIALDTVGEKLYLSNAWGKIQRMNLDGSNFQPNLITGLTAPQNLVLDTTNRKLYWTEQTSQSTGKIQRANLDGSTVQLVKELTSVPRGMALDAVNRKLYLTNAWGKLQRMNLDGSNFQPDFITGLASPGQVVVDRVGGKLYWTEKGKLRHADLNGENIQDVVTGLGKLADIGLGIDSAGETGVAAAPVLRKVVEQTQLLANYPNPFNPETWIPYQLSEPAEVTVRIYSVKGILVRTLALGQTPAGIYQNRSRAAYWDGRNDVGESVASGLYFYTLTAGDFTATRRMLIRK